MGNCTKRSTVYSRIDSIIYLNINMDKDVTIEITWNNNFLKFEKLQKRLFSTKLNFHHNICRFLLFEGNLNIQQKVIVYKTSSPHVQTIRQIQMLQYHPLYLSCVLQKIFSLLPSAVVSFMSKLSIF